MHVLSVVLTLAVHVLSGAVDVLSGAVGVLSGAVQASAVGSKIRNSKHSGSSPSPSGSGHGHSHGGHGGCSHNNFSMDELIAGAGSML